MPPVIGLCFDGRKDPTLIYEATVNKRRRITQHISLVSELGSQYIGHLSCCWIKWNNNKYWSKKCGNSFARERTKSPSPVTTCLFPINELPLRYLIKETVGETSGPREHKGPIDQKLEYCETLPIVRFKRFGSNLLQMDCKESDLILSTETGNVSASLASGNPAKLSHARWLTTANQIMRLYVATEVPDECLCLLVEYIIKVYAPF
nr:unnamed protein product [Callosobruchus analis]